MLSDTYLRRLFDIRTGRLEPETKYEEQALLNAVLTSAPAIQGDFERDAFLLRYVDGLTWEKIADLLHSTTADNVTKRCRIAVNKVRRARYS